MKATLTLEDDVFLDLCGLTPEEVMGRLDAAQPETSWPREDGRGEVRAADIREMNVIEEPEAPDAPNMQRID